MRVQLRIAAFCALVALLILGVMPVAATPLPTNEDPSVLAHRVVELVNQEREKNGLLPLKWNDSLAAAGAAYAKDLATRNFFAHNSPEGSTPVSRARDAGYPAYGWGNLYVGENLARGFPTAEGAMQGWMNSEGHRNNLLNPKYRETGVGVAVASSGAIVIAQEFGSRPNILPIFINQDAGTTDSPKVTLSISLEDVSSWGSVGKTTQMMVSNNDDFAGASWEPYSSTKSWTLSPEPGLKTVYVRMKDDRGSTVNSSGTIVLSGRQYMALQSGPSAAPAPVPGPTPAPEFKLGFKALADQIPEIVGKPVGNEQTDADGNSLQATTGGLLVWLKEFNWTAFTNGFRTWVNGPYGILDRANDERFGWEQIRQQESAR